MADLRAAFSFDQAVGAAFIQLAQQRQQSKELILIVGIEGRRASLAADGDGKLVVILAGLTQDFIDGFQGKFGWDGVTKAD